MVMHARKPQRMNDGKPAEPVNIKQGRWGKQRTIMYTQQIRNPRKKLNLQYRSQSVPSRIGETATIAGGVVLVTHRAKSDVEDISSDDSSPGDKDDYVCNFRKTAGGNEIEEAEPVRVLDYRTRVPRHHRVRPIESTIRDTTPEVKYLLKTQKLIKHKQKQDHSHAKGICLFRYKNQRRMSISNTQECSDKNVHSRRKPPCLKSSRTNTRNHNSKRKRSRSPENSCILDDGNRHMQLGVIFRRPSFVPDNWIHPCDPRLENSVSNEQNRPPIVYLVPQWNDMLKPSSPNFEKNLLPLPPRKAAADQTPKCKVNSPLKSQTKLNSSSQTKVKNTTNAELFELTTLPKLTSATSTKQQYEIIATTLNKQQTSFAGTNAIVVNSALKTTIFGILNQTPEHSDQIVSKHNCKAATTLGLLSKTLLTEHEKSIMDSVDVNLMFDDASGDEQCAFANEDHSDYNNVDQFAFYTKTENLEINENTRIFQDSFDLGVSRCRDDPIEVLANDCLETDIKEKLESYCSIESSTLSVANTALEQQDSQDDLSNKMTDRKTSSMKIPTSQFKNSYESVHKNVNNDDNAQFNHLETNFVNTNESNLDYNNTHDSVSCRAGPNEMKQETKQSSKHDSNKSPVHSRKKSHKKRKKERRKKVTKNKTLKTPKSKKTASFPESELVAYIENTLEYNNMLEDVTKQITAEHVQNANETAQRSPDINDSQTIKTFEISPSIEKSEKSPKTEKEILNDSPGHNINADSPLSDSTTLSDKSLNARVLNLFELFNKYPQAIEQPVKCTRTFLSLSDLTTCVESRLPKNRNCEISSTPTQDMFSNKFQKTYNCSKLTNCYDFRQKINQANNEPLEYANDIKRVLSTRPVALQLRHSLSSGNDAILECNDVFKCNNVAVDLRYFEKHQSHSYQGSKYSSKRDYERDRSSYRDRDISPGAGAGGGGGSLNNGNSYRSQSPDIDSPSSRGGGGGGHGTHDIRDRGDHRGGGRGGSGERYSYIQKMRDRDRDVYKKDKYSDKRDRRGGGGSGGNDRDSESYRTNHDRERRGAGSGGGGGGAKLCSSRDNDKRSGSDDRERERDRDLRDLRDKRDRASDRDRDIYKKDKYSDKRERGGDRGERVARCGDWSEHVSSSGKMYYYNCKTEVSQWEKPKEWLDRERNLPRDQHREKDYRDKDRERDRDDRFSRSAYTKHSSSRDNSRLRWNYDNDGGPPSHRRRLDGRHNENADMDISGDSTPTSEASYSLTGTPTTHGTQLNDQNAVMPPGTLPCTLGNALPRLASHPNPMPCATSSASSVAAASSVAMHFPSVVANVGGGGGGSMNSTMATTGGLATVPQSIGGATIGTMPLTANSLRNTVVGGSHIGSTTNATVLPTLTNQGDHHLNSNAPGPPIKLLNSKDASDFLIGVPHKSTLIMRHHSGAHSTPETTHHMLISGASTDTTNHVYNSANTVPLGLRDNPVNSPLYNVTHQHHSLSPLLNYTKSPIPTIVGHTNNVNVNSTSANNAGVGVAVGSSIGVGAGMTAAYSCNPTFGLKTVEGGIGSNSNAGGVLNATSGIGAVSGISVITSMGSNSMCSSSSSLANVAGGGGSGGGVGHVPGEGPPTPTQELDLSTAALEQQQQQRKPVDNTSSSSLSTLQSCVGSSAQAGNMRGPEISPKLGKFYRPDLISHVTNWQAEALERQVRLLRVYHTQKCSEDTHMYGDLTCTRICAELKCARSLVRTTEINATLQEQKVMYLRQQIRRLEESKTQNSFMSDDT